MKPCPRCDAPNLETAKFCCNCTQSFNVKQKGNTKLLVIVLLSCFAVIAPIFAVLGVASYRTGYYNTPLDYELVHFISRTQNPKQEQDNFPSNPPSQSNNKISQPLKLLSSRGETGENYVTVVGEVQNISAEKIDGLQVAVTNYDSGGQLISTEDSFVDYQPLMSNQTTPFKVMIRANPLMKTYRITFKKFAGEQISYIDARVKTSGKKK